MDNICYNCVYMFRNAYNKCYCKVSIDENTICKCEEINPNGTDCRYFKQNEVSD